MGWAMDTATVSIIGSVIIALAGIFGPIISRTVTDRQTWERQRKETAIDKIDKACGDVINSLSRFWVSYTDGDTKATILQAVQAWEQTLHSYANADQRGKIRAIRTELFQLKHDRSRDGNEFVFIEIDMHNDNNYWTNRILDITHEVKQQVK